MSFLGSLFGGGKKDKAKAAAKPAASPPKTADKPKAAASVTVLPVAAAARPRTAAGVVTLKLAYAAKVRAGDAAGAYGAACELARLYKKARVPSLAAEYRAAADAQFAQMLAAGGRRARLAAKSPRAEKLLGKAHAGLIAAHRDFTAKFEGRVA